MLLELTDADFEAYGEGRTRATALTKPRGDVKRRLLVWAQAVREQLAAEGIELELAATDEHPSARNGHRVDAQSVFLFRAERARRAMRLALGSAAKQDEARPEAGHARIEARVDASSVSLLLWLGADARIDLESAALVFESPAMNELWASLPEGACIDARPALSSRARKAGDLEVEQAAQMAKDALDAEVPLVIGLRAPRARATQPKALEPFFDAAIALGRFMSAVAWSPERAAARARAPRERPSRRARRAARPERPEPRSSEARARSETSIDRGARVLALAGPFAGQSGVVQELDGKGGARVLFGLLAARVELRDLTTASTAKRGRILLSSSHRKPGS